MLSPPLNSSFCRRLYAQSTTCKNPFSHFCVTHDHSGWVLVIFIVALPIKPRHRNISPPIISVVVFALNRCLCGLSIGRWRNIWYDCFYRIVIICSFILEYSISTRILFELFVFCVYQCTNCVVYSLYSSEESVSSHE
jgi:hypothetical protein